MNRDWVTYHLREGLEELQSTMAEIEATPDYGYGEFSVAMAHLDRHINTAWNARAEPELQVRNCSDHDLHRWERFPADLAL
jgi:hypothetical protein